MFLSYGMEIRSVKTFSFFPAILIYLIALKIFYNDSLIFNYFILPNQIFYADLCLSL